MHIKCNMVNVNRIRQARIYFIIHIVETGKSSEQLYNLSSDTKCSQLRHIQACCKGVGLSSELKPQNSAQQFEITSQ